MILIVIVALDGAETPYTGARVSELLGADVEDLGTDRGHRVLRVRRKYGG